MSKNWLVVVKFSEFDVMNVKCENNTINQTLLALVTVQD